ncbi:MAG TPA: hypothetical protein VLF21_00505 [Candidatus Saccharimonadales bacterium]|nr:hypothetical protein [Candidatus Saccharimonadales bacterium]
MRNRVLIILGTVFVITVIILGFFQSTRQTVNIDLQNAKKIEIFQDTGGEGHPGKRRLVASLPGSGKLSLPKGVYVYNVVAKNSDFEDKAGFFKVENRPVSLAVKCLFSQIKLAQLAFSEGPAIIGVLNGAYPSAMPSYSVDVIRIYEIGEWAAVKLSPKNPQLAVVRVVLKKINGNWVVATDPPAIILSRPVFPDVPKNILDDINNNS